MVITLAGAATVHSAVLITEIMYNPAGSDYDPNAATPYNREWVEIYNTASTPVDIGGWQFGDAQDGQWAAPIPIGTILGAGKSLVLTGNAATFDAQWGAGLPRLQVGSFPDLSNSPSATNEIAAIRNSAGAVQDVVNFQAGANGWFATNGSQGQSLFALPAGIDQTANDLGTNWRPSSWGAYGAKYRNADGGNHGSPGFVPLVTQPSFEPSSDAEWSIVIFPDTQNYSKSSVDKPIFSLMSNWVKDHRDDFNIQLVMQEGDLVNNNDTENPSSGDQTGDQQWANARAAMSVLDGHVPYIIAVGNHDIGTTNAQTRDTQMNTYFNQSQNPLIDPAQGGILRGYHQSGKLENAYFELNAPDGRDLLIFSLEYWPRNSVIGWANQIAGLPQYADHAAVLLTHSYLHSNEQLWTLDPASVPIGPDGNDGVAMWSKLVSKHGNFEMTFNGHITGDGIGYKRSIADEGNVVHQMLIDTQAEANGGNGWLRVVEFLKDGRTARIRTYSPYLDLYKTDPANQFLIDLTPLFSSLADYNHDFQVDGLDLAVLTSNFGLATAGQMTGDANDDGVVDGTDFLAWQRSVDQNAPTAAVPEPATVGLIAITAIFILARRLCYLANIIAITESRLRCELSV